MDVQWYNGYFIMAVTYNRIDLVREYLRHGINPTVSTSSLFSEYRAIYSEILQDIISLNKTNQAIEIACLHGYVEIAGMLLYDSRVGIKEAFKYALMAPHIRVIDMLISDKRFDPKWIDDMNIINHEVIPILMQHPDYNINNDEMIDSLCYESTLPILSQVLLDPRCHVMEYLDALMFLYEHKKYDILQQLIKDGRITGPLLDKFKFD